MFFLGMLVGGGIIFVVWMFCAMAGWQSRKEERQAFLNDLEECVTRYTTTTTPRYQGVQPGETIVIGDVSVLTTDVVLFQEGGGEPGPRE